MLTSPRRCIHQGAVFARVPTPWLPPPLWVLRPRQWSYPDMSPRLASQMADLFAGEDGEEAVVLRAKARPVVVVSPHPELRHLRQVRVVPLYSYRSESALTRMRPAIESGTVAGACHLVGSQRFGIEDGVLRLDQAQAVHAAFLDRQVASLSETALGSLLTQLGRYVQALDRRDVG